MIEVLARTPLFDEHVSLGGKLVPFAGWEMPVQYPTGITAEHRAVRSAAGLFDVSHMGEFVVRGPQVLELLQQGKLFTLPGAGFDATEEYADDIARETTAFLA